MQIIFMSLLTAGLIIVSAGFFSLRREINNLKSAPQPVPKQVVVSSNALDIAPSQVDLDNQVETDSKLSALKAYVDSSVATIAGQRRTEVVYKETTSKSTPQTSFVSLGSTATTTSTGWIDVADSGVYIDLINDYSADAKVTFEASLKVANANGQAFARLWDDTNKIAVVGSEISTTNNADYKQVISGNLALWRGKNLYKVQIKSLNSFVVTISSARVKISY